MTDRTLAALVIGAMAAGCSQEEPVALRHMAVSTALALPPGPLPEVCLPWRPAPEAVLVPEAENPMFEGRKDRKLCFRRGEAGPGEDLAGSDKSWCDAYSDVNMRSFASERLFPLGPDGIRVPYGSSIGCKPPLTLDAVACYADLNDHLFRTVERILVECRGDRLCGRSDAARCCRTTARDKVDPPVVPREPTGEEATRWEEERCGRLRDRREACSRYCTHPAYAARCASYWGYVDPACRKVRGAD